MAHTAGVVSISGPTLQAVDFSVAYSFGVYCFRGFRRVVLPAVMLGKVTGRRIEVRRGSARALCDHVRDDVAPFPLGAAVLDDDRQPVAARAQLFHLGTAGPGRQSNLLPGEDQRQYGHEYSSTRPNPPDRRHTKHQKV